MRRTKQFLAVLASLAMVAAATPAHVRAAEKEMGTEGTERPKMEFSEVEKPEEKPEETKPKKNKAITLKPAGEDTPAFKYSEAKELKIELTNTSKETIENITVKPKVTTAMKNWPFEIEKISYEKKVDKIEAGKTAEVVYKLVPRATVESKYYKVNFKVAYGEQDYEQSLFVKMEGKPEEPKKPDKHPDIDITIEGNGNTGTGGSTSGGGVSGGTISGGSGSVISGGDEVFSSGDGGSVTNEGESKGNGLTPRVIVTGFTTEPGEVRAGSNFTLVVHLKNTSKKTAVENMLFDFNAPSEGDENTAAPAFLPSSGSSVVYLEKIKANGTTDISIDMNAKADLVQKPYSIEVSMKYEDRNGGQYESAANISVPVKQDARFEFSEFEMSSETVEVGSETNVMCNLYNLGRVKLYNVKAKFEGEGLKSKELFLGNVEPGATAAIDGMVAGEQATTGDGKAKLSISYEDEAGNISNAEKEFTLLVTEPVMDETMTDDPSMMAPEEEKGFPVIPVVLGALGVAAITAFAVIKVRKKKKAVEKEEEFLEDELDRLTEDE